MSETICRLDDSQSCGCQNLNDVEVKKRKILGYGSMVVAFALVAMSKVQQPPDWVQAMPAIPFFFAYLNMLQARTRTCVMLALLEKDMSDGQLQPVQDRASSWSLKKRSFKLIAAAGALAVVSAAICWKL